MKYKKLCGQLDIKNEHANTHLGNEKLGNLVFRYKEHVPISLVVYSAQDKQ